MITLKKSFAMLVAPLVLLTTLMTAAANAAQPMIAASVSYTCALTSAGGVKCWGDRNYGQVGDNLKSSFPPLSAPVSVSGLASGVTKIVAGGAHTCAAVTTGGVRCWGSNGEGALGNGSTSVTSYVPVAVSGLAENVIGPRCSRSDLNIR